MMKPPIPRHLHVHLYNKSIIASLYNVEYSENYTSMLTAVTACSMLTGRIGDSCVILDVIRSLILVDCISTPT